MDVEALFLEWKAGDAVAYDRLFLMYYPVMRRYASGLGLEDAESEEVVQDCFCRLWQRLPLLSEVHDFKSYLYTSIRNASFNRLKFNKRKQQREQRFYEAHEHIEPGVEYKWIEAEILIQLRTAIQELPEQCSKIVWLSYVDGLSGKEIAQRMGLTVSTVNNQKSRGVKLLRKIFSAETFVFFLMTQPLVMQHLSPPIYPNSDFF